MQLFTLQSHGVADLVAARYMNWRETVEVFITVEGARCLLEHVGEDVWRTRYAANEDAYSAVIEELQKVD